MTVIKWFILFINFCSALPANLSVTSNFKLNNLNLFQHIPRFIFNARPVYFLGVFFQGTVGRKVNDVNIFFMLSDPDHSKVASPEDIYIYVYTFRLILIIYIVRVSTFNKKKRSWHRSPCQEAPKGSWPGLWPRLSTAGPLPPAIVLFAM